jgi:Flp pilus assembly protein TadG
MGADWEIRPSLLRRGQVTILVGGIILVFLLLFFVVGMDYARLYYVRGELQNAADAAALAGAPLLSCQYDDGSSGSVLQSAARDAAATFASQNNAAGAPVILQLNSGNVSSNSVLTDNGDIVVGNWDGANFTAADGAHPTLAINAIRVIARRTSEAVEDGVKTGDNPVFTLFGKLVGWRSMNVIRQAIAVGCLVNLSPIAVNEYWMGDIPLGAGLPTVPDSTRQPYGMDHVYPNSFVRPPCTAPGVANCSSPFNGNVSTWPGGAGPNGPLNVACTGTDCEGRPTPTSGRVFAIVGGQANANVTPQQVVSLIDLDDRVNNSKAGSSGDQWFNVSGFTYTPESFPKANSNKDIVAGYIKTGTYPNEPPTSVVEIFQPAYTTTTNYPSSQPYASTSFYSGAGVAGQVVNSNYYDSGNFSNSKYAPGNKILVAVYDGIQSGSGSTDWRTTIVGFTEITIFGYGNRLRVVGPNIGTSGPQNTMYGYVASEADSLKQSIFDLPDVRRFGRLVK